MLVVTAIMVLSLCYILKVLTLCTTNAGGTRTMDIRGRSGGCSVIPFRAHFDRLMIVYAVFFCFMIWGQKIDVKHIMNLERRRKFKAVCVLRLSSYLVFTCFAY